MFHYYLTRSATPPIEGASVVASILIIDDDERLAAPLKSFLTRYDMTLHSATHPDTGLSLLMENEAGPPFDLVILDVMLPDRDGFEVCKMIRKKSEIPIIMLTARGEVMDRVQGLESGADDYLPKPFEPRELVARIQNILRRTGSASQPKPPLLFERLEIDQGKQEVKIDNKIISLTSNEYQLLILFTTHPGEKLSRDDISGKMRGADIEIFSRAVDIQVSRLRQKLKPTDYIKTVWGAGYQFVAPERKEVES